MKRFLLVDEGRGPWFGLLCLDGPRLAFTVVDPRQIQVSYQPSITPQMLAEAEASSGEDVALLALAVEGPSGPETINLLAPLIVNLRQRLGVQIVLDPNLYPLRHPVRAGA